MAKKVLIISTSLRKSSNSDVLADFFYKGAKEAGNEVEKVTLNNKTINFCKGCLACQKVGHCVIDDDANAITEKMLNSQVIVFATPIYYYEMSGQMKTVIDRANSLFSADYAFGDIYLLATAAEDNETALHGALTGVKGWIDCFDNARLAGTVFAGGVDAAGDIKDHPALEKAYQMGKNV